MYNFKHKEIFWHGGYTDDMVLLFAELIVSPVHYILDLTWTKSGFAAVNNHAMKVCLIESALYNLT